MKWSRDRKEFNSIYEHILLEAKGSPTKREITDLDDFWEEVSKKIHDTGKATPAQVHQARDKYARILTNAVFYGFGTDGSDIDYDSANGKMVEALINNCYFFSAAKSHSQLNALTSGVIDPSTGKIRPWNEFQSFAKTVNNDHIMRYLHAEYNLAINTAQMSAKWVEIQKEKDIFPYLEFDAVMDRQTTPICSEFNGKVFHVDDPIWNIIFPPNHWGCRSTVRKVRGRTPDDSSTLDTSTVKNAFRNNLAKDGMPWPEDSAYFKGMPDGWKNTLGDARFKVLDRPGRKGVVMESGINVKGTNYDERDRRRYAADILAHQKEGVFFLLPELKHNKDFRYQYYYQNIKYVGKTPDLRNADGYWDVTHYEHKYNFGKMETMLDKINIQSDKVVILMSEYIDESILKKDALKVLKNKNKTEAEIIFIYPNGNIYNLKQPQQS